MSTITVGQENTDERSRADFGHVDLSETGQHCTSKIPLKTQ